MGIEIEKVKNGSIVKAAVGGNWRDTVTARWVVEGDESHKVGSAIKRAQDWVVETKKKLENAKKD